MTQRAYTGLCEDSSEALHNQCEAFCAMDGGIPSLAISLGNEAYGFNLSEMDSFCVGRASSDVVSFDSDIGANCLSWSQALSRINDAMRAFLVVQTKFEIQQRVHIAEVEQKWKR